MPLEDIKYGRVDDILVQRGSVYGEFADNADASQDLKSVFARYVKAGTQHPSATRPLPNYVLEALDLIALKLSRILTGDPFYADNWDDIAGYAKLVADRVRAKKALDQFEPVPDSSPGLIAERTGSSIDIAKDGAWHASHSLTVIRYLGEDVDHLQCVNCKLRDDDVLRSLPCHGSQTSELRFSNSGVDER